MKRSRLTRRIERQTKTTIFISLLGSLIIIVAFVKFGLPMLINLSLMISSANGAQETQKKGHVFVSPPVLNALPEATNSARLIISGSAGSKEKVALYINDELISKIDVEEDNTFLFDDVRLPSDSNTGYKRKRLLR